MGSGSLFVVKRDGKSREEYNSYKARVAILKAAGEANEFIVEDRMKHMLTTIGGLFLNRTEVGVEEIQDLVERTLMEFGFTATAKKYILYRDNRRKAREVRLKPDPNALADYIHPGKYARYIEPLRRREVYPETVKRNHDMHRRRFADNPAVLAAIDEAYEFVYDKRVLPSMRSMQFAGAAVEQNNARLFNCCFSFIDRPRVFAEAMWLLLSGCGVGFSVQFEHVEKLPALKHIDRNKVKHHTIADHIIGWSDAVDRLIDSYLKGYYVEFDYHKIRDKGTPLKTSGGVAPGHLGLKASLEAIRLILDSAQGRKLEPIECYDTMCHIASAVLSGGIRRSAMICLFSPMDGHMMNAKPKDYWKDLPWRKGTPWRGYSNNSVMLKRDEVTKKQFRHIFRMTRQAGEPGFYFCASNDHGTNPCVEIGLDSKLVINDETIGIMAQWVEEAKQGKFLCTDDHADKVYAHRSEVLEWAKKHMGREETGWAFCNLTTQNATKFEKPEDMYAAAQAAATIGSVQATYTRFPYLNWTSEIIARRDALLGVSMTGIMAKPAITLDPTCQQHAAQVVNQTNQKMAKLLGIRVAARTTCVKPEGTGSKELGIGEEGIHLAHARRYVQTIIANEDEAPFKHFQATNPHMCVKMPGSTNWAIYFPMEAPAGAKVRSDMTAVEFLKNVLNTQKNWVLPGTVRPEQSPGLTHNVSNTVTVRDNEWDDVADYVYEHRNFFTGLSFLSFTGDKEYGPFAPKQTVETEADEARWNELVRQYKPVNYLDMIEERDNTAPTLEIACAGGACTI